MERGARRRQRKRAMPPLEERKPERLLERLDLPRQRRLRQEQLFGGERERQPPPGRLEAAQEVELRQRPQRSMHAFHACPPCRLIV